MAGLVFVYYNNAFIPICETRGENSRVEYFKRQLRI